MDTQPLDQTIVLDGVEPNTSECIDPQYACLEATLLDHWDQKKVPLVFLHNQREYISKTVQIWWDMQVEACCIRNDLNRTNWQRTFPEGDIESTASLYERVKVCRTFIFPDDILSMRDLELDEKLAVMVLDSAVAYYEHLVFSRYRE